MSSSGVPFFARFPVPLLGPLGRVGGLIAGVLAALAWLGAAQLGERVGPWNGTELWSPSGTAIAIGLGAVGPLLALQALWLLARGRPARPALPDAELVKRLCSTERPLTVCLDCRTLSAVPPCDHCGQSSSCLEILNRADAKNALSLLQLEPIAIARPPELSAEFGTALRRAIAEATTRRHEWVGLEHLLLGLLSDPGFCALLGVDPIEPLKQRLLAELEATAARVAEGVSAEPKPTPELERVLQKASVHALFSGGDVVKGTDVLVAMCREETTVAVKLLVEAGVDREAVLGSAIS